MNEAASKVRTLSPVNPPNLAEQQWLEEDSINLVDLWLELVKRRMIIFSSVALALIAGLLLAFFLPQKYTYSTSIEIGYAADKTDGGLERSLIDNPETVLAKLTTSYIPQAQQQFAMQHPDNVAIPEIKVSIPKGSQLITLEGKGPETQNEAFVMLLQSVLDNLLSDHQRVTDLTRIGLQTQLDQAKLSLTQMQDPRTLQVQINDLNAKLNGARITREKLRNPRVLEGPQQKIEAALQKANLDLKNLLDPRISHKPLLAIKAELQKAEMALEKLRDPRFFAAKKQGVEASIIQAKKHIIDTQDQAELIKSRYQRLNETDTLLKKQISELETQITTTLKRRQQALDGLQTEASAMTMLMVDNEIQQNRLRLASLEERLYIKLQDQRQELEDRLATNQREQGVQQQMLVQLEGDLERVVLENERQQTLKLPLIDKLKKDLDRQTLTNKQQQILTRTHINKLKGDLERLTLSNQRAQQLDEPRVAQLEAQLAKLKADHQRKLISQQHNIRLLEARLQGLAETRALTPPMQSLKPSGPGKALIIILALILGLMIGVFAAFFASFLSKVKQQTASEAP